MSHSVSHPEVTKWQFVGHTRMSVWPKQEFLLLIHNIGNSRVKLTFLASPGKNCSMWPKFPHCECGCQAVAVSHKRTVSPLHYKVYHSVASPSLRHTDTVCEHLQANERAPRRSSVSNPPLPSAAWQLWYLTGPESSHLECSSKRLKQDKIQGSPETHFQSS